MMYSLIPKLDREIEELRRAGEDAFSSPHHRMSPGPPTEPHIHSSGTASLPRTPQHYPNQQVPPNRKVCVRRSCACIRATVSCGCALLDVTSLLIALKNFRQLCFNEFCSQQYEC